MRLESLVQPDADVLLLLGAARELQDRAELRRADPVARIQLEAPVEELGRAHLSHLGDRKMWLPCTSPVSRRDGDHAHFLRPERRTRGLIGTDATPLPDLRLDQRDEPRALPLRGGARAVRDLRRAHRVRRRPLRVLRRLQVGLPVLQAAMRARAPARRRADPRGDPRAEETAGEGSRKSVSAHVPARGEKSSGRARLSGCMVKSTTLVLFGS